MEPTCIELPTFSQVSTLVQACSAASPEFGAALQKGTSVAEALGRLGFRLCRENKADAAVEVFRAAVAAEPDNPACWLNLAVALDRVGLFRTAASCLEHTLSIADQQPAAWLLLGAVRTKLPDLSGAEAAYQEALRLDSDSSLAWLCLGSVKQERGDLAGAIDCFSASMARDGKTAAMLANLGKLHYQVGQFTQSVEAYTNALELDCGNVNYLQMLQRAQFLHDLSDGHVDEALAAYQCALQAHAPEPETDLNAVLQNAFTMLNGFGHREAAIRVGRKWVELCPTSACADYRLKALMEQPGMERAPAEYIVEYFDGFSEGFDEKLVTVLRYDLPAKVCALLSKVAGAERQFETLEIGCGTGLCGTLLKPISRELIGVDLSPKMLEQARRRNAYDTLHCEELLTFLQRSPGRYDLVVASDVLIYFGDLRPVWAGVRHALRPGGLLAFSTESVAGPGYRLQSSGRFAHSLDYVRSTTAETFTERAWEEITIREEATEAVRGNLFVVGRR